MTSRPVYTSTAEGFRDEREIAGLRPVAAPKPRAPRKPAERRVVTNGIVCFCGERFAESQSLEFMLHLRAEMGEVLEMRKRKLEYQREYNKTPESRAYNRARKRSVEYREREREWQREWRSTPEGRERQLEYQRRYRERNRERINAAKRERRAREKAEA